VPKKGARLGGHPRILVNGKRKFGVGIEPTRTRKNLLVAHHLPSLLLYGIHYSILINELLFDLIYFNMGKIEKGDQI